MSAAPDSTDTFFDCLDPTDLASRPTVELSSDLSSASSAPTTQAPTSCSSSGSSSSHHMSVSGGRLPPGISRERAAFDPVRHAGVSAGPVPASTAQQLPTSASPRPPVHPTSGGQTFPAQLQLARAENSAARRTKIQKITEEYLAVPRHWERMKAPGPADPEETYEMSTDYENSEESPDRTKKKMPKWCQTWVQEFEKQSNIDPDTVFGGNLKPVDLEEVFKDHGGGQGGAGSNKRRMSTTDNLSVSERWGRDKLRKEEVLNYKQMMGQTVRMDHIWHKPPL